MIIWLLLGINRWSVRFSSCLDKHKYLDDFVAFFQLVATKSYPLTCIALPCWLDTIKWYVYETTSQYGLQRRNREKTFLESSVQTTTWVCDKIFSGVKSIGQVVSGEANRRQINPQDSDIYFAVPGPGNSESKMALTPQWFAWRGQSRNMP